MTGPETMKRILMSQTVGHRPTYSVTQFDDRFQNELDELELGWLVAWELGREFITYGI